MDYFKVPQARNWAIPLLISVTLFIYANTRTNVTTAVMIMFGISGVFVFWFGMNFLHHFYSVLTDEWTRRREVEFKFHPNYQIEKIQQMNDHQLKAVRIGKLFVEVIPGQNGRVDMLKYADCYLYTAWWILCHSTNYSVYPINNFKQGTYHFDVAGDQGVDDYEQAKSFHHWLKMMGYAEWGRGNTSMTWNEGFNPDKVLSLLDMDKETFEDD